MTARPGPFAQRAAAELRAELARQEHSIRWLAEQINIHHATVSRWIGADTTPDLDEYEAMCRALGWSVADLLEAVNRNGGFQPAPLRTRGRARILITESDIAASSGRDTGDYVARSPEFAAA